jgi:hypothetical protein
MILDQIIQNVVKVYAWGTKRSQMQTFGLQLGSMNMSQRDRMQHTSSDRVMDNYSAKIA